MVFKSAELTRKMPLAGSCGSRRDGDSTALDAAVDRRSLGGASVDGLVITLAAQLARLGMQFGYQIILARLLTPRDFGLIAMAAPVLAFVALFGDFGMTQATIQRASITPAELSFMFWTNSLLGIALAIVTVALAPLVGWFFNAPEVTWVTMALGAPFVLGGLCSQHLALLNRHLEFGKLAIFDLVSFGAGATAGIVAAMAGMTFWAIVAGQAVMALVSLPLAWSFTGWVPGKPRWILGARNLLGFGGNITAFSFVNYFARNLDNVLIGRFVGETALGLYDRAYKLLLLPLSQFTGPFTRVAMPLLARTRDEPDLYRRAYLRMLELVLLLTYPGVIFALCSSHQLIVILLGERWVGVVPIFSVLGFGALFAPIGNSTGWLFITQDRTREMRDLGALSSLVFIFSFVVGLPWGALGVAISYIAFGVVQGPMIWWLTTRRGPVTFSQLRSALYPFIAGAIVTALVEIGLVRMLPPGPLALALLLVLAYASFLSVLACVPRGREILNDVIVKGQQLAARVTTKAFEHLK